jgi:Pentatricopeptide repeat domain
MSTLATAWAKSRCPEASAMVESILCYMETKALVPNLITYNSVLHAVATSGGLKMDRGMRAQRIIDSMKDNGCEPDVYSYQMLIQAWSKTIVDNAPERAERILKHLENEAYNGNKQLAANAHCYTGRFRCLVGWLCLSELITLSLLVSGKCLGKVFDSPLALHVTLLLLPHPKKAVIYAWTNSQEPEKARRAYELFGRQCKPNVVIFTAVINACARPAQVSEKLGSFQIAQLTMEEALVLGEANFLTFAAFLGVCSHTLLPSTLRDGTVKRTFEQCRDAGQVGRIVLEKLKQAASPVLYKELVGSYPLDGNDIPTQLPKTWTKNIRGERERPVPVT